MKSRTYLLLTGVLLTVIGTIMVFFAGTTIDFYVSTSSLDDLLSKSPLWIVFLLGCIGAPVIEEFTFRYWAKGTVASKVTSSILILISCYMIFSYLIFNYWLLFILLAVLTISIVLLFCLKKRDWHFVVMAVFTSMLFAILHDVTSFTELDIWNMVSLIGFSFIAIYMVVRWNIFAAMGFHAAWNFVALCIPIIIAPIFEKPIEPQNIISESMCVKIEQVGDAPLPDMRIVKSDSVILTNASMTEIVRCLSEKNDNKHVLVDNIDEVRYNVIGSISSERDLESLRDSIVGRLAVVFDTVKPSNKFMLMSLDKINRSFPTEEMTYAPPSHIMSRLETLYNKRVIFVNSDRTIPMTTKSYYAFGDEDDRDKVLLILKEQGISVLKPSETDVELVVITSP